MKKFLVILPFLIISCQKKEVISENGIKSDSVILSDQTVIDNKIDSAANGIVAIDDLNATKATFKTFRIVDGDSIVKTINADMIPLTITDEFTPKVQKMVLKIKNFDRAKIVGKITSENPQMNIRFNQIKLTNGDFDGPFGRELNYEIKEKGEIWLIIAKSNMASGDATGKFKIRIE